MKRALLLIFLLSVPTFASPEAATIPKNLDELLWWMPEDSETLEVYQGPIKVVNPRPEVEENISQLIGKDRSISFDADTRNSIILQRYLVGSVLTLEVSASRHFRDAKGLGYYPYDGCTAYLFSASLGQKKARLSAALAKAALKVETLEGAQVFEFRDKLEDEFWNTYLAFPRPDVLLQCTDRSFTIETLHRMRTRGERRAFAADLPEWQQLDMAAPVFALRHFAHEGVADDPTSPYSTRGEQAGGGAFKQLAPVGVVYFISAGGNRAMVRYLAAGPNLEEVMRQIWTIPNVNPAPTLRRISPTVIEISAPISDEQTFTEFWFRAECMMGKCANV